MDMYIIGVIVAAVLSMVIGAIWYSPYAFGKEWMQLTNTTMEDTKDAGKAYVGVTIMALIMASVLAMVITYAEANDLISGAIIGFFMWLGFVAPAHFSGVLWERKPLKLFCIHAGCMLVTLIVMGAVIGVLS